MPITKQAIKKMRRDKRRQLQNQITRGKLAQAIRKARRSPTPKTLASATSLLDKAAKVHLIHLNRAARLQSRLANLLKKK